MRMLDLFSGIGGFSLAASWVWGDELEIVAFCEIDNFCQKVLRKHWPDVLIIEDIREVTGERIATYTKSREDYFGKGRGVADAKGRWSRGDTPIGISNQYDIDLLTGGFPCQPFSCAGKRKGRDDDRFLWPEMLRVIREVHPTWIIAENVGGIFTQEQGMVFNQVLSDLEAEGYEVQPFCIPACSKNAPHRRDRWWIVAHSLDNTDRTDRGQIRETDSIQGERGKALGGRVFTGTDCHVTDTECERLLRLGQKGSIVREWELEQDIKERCEVGSNDARCNTGWSENWLEVATRLCRVDDGVSTRLDFNLGRIGYGNTNSFRNTEEAIAKISEYRRSILFNMWEQYQGAKTSHRARLVGVYSGMPEMPYRDTHEEWYLGERIKESKELQDMWSSILSKPFQETFNLQQKMLVRIGEKECNEKMETKRVDRLKSLGNAIVPQVAYEIMKAIRQAGILEGG